MGRPGYAPSGEGSDRGLGRGRALPTSGSAAAARAWAGSCRQRDAASSRRRSPAGRWISGSLGVNRRRTSGIAKPSRGHGYSSLSMTVVEVSAGTGGAAWSDLMTQYSDRCECAARIAYAMSCLCAGAFSPGVVAERRRLGDAADSDARYRAMSVGGRPASGPPVSGTEPRWVGRRAQVDVPPAQLCTREARIRAGSVGPRVWAGAACASWTAPVADQDPPGSRGEPRISIT